MNDQKKKYKWITSKLFHLFIFSFSILIIYFSYLTPIYSQTIAPDIDVEINVDGQYGPELDSSDFSKITSCLKSNFQSTFPWGFVTEPLPSVTDVCPTFIFFGHTQKYCFILNIYTTLRPAILIGLMSYAIFNL